MIRYTIILFVAILFSACGDDINSDYENGRNNILGTWQYTESITIEDIGQVNNGVSGTTGSLTFENDGTGTKTISFFDITTNFEWIYQLSPEKISIISKSDSTSQGFLSFGDSRLFEIIENRIDNQQWIANDHALFFIDSTTQIAKRETRLEMTR